jgi:hypothetical protein
MYYCVPQFFCQCNKIPEQNDLREEGLILAHDFRSFSPSQWTAVVEPYSSAQSSQEAGAEDLN